ncbi:diguanylate cyclase (GGDEF) domain-containing protein [Sphaerochaeta pleomorpha str. Grapes]|uniref:Diguanylate cyclase (GGDEF) domain-containing protein n=1 Tax=Sphaerochaeta pleomorpha (strain ATCC BAA-1885 / DSM 22778 / Grapes) TaxID=158190 RepID=G8QVF2_SPHPG|nr:EAL domain-containing protein [Sphaerochaeta pleomorpha]AEV28185.1 diguanylate cyclase (GGDEF) domain-containing protein [Sphaerochaeta pleomorpha str. Grapes]
MAEGKPDNSRLSNTPVSINNLPGGVGVFEFGEDCKATYLSKGISTLFGYSDQEFQNCLDLDLFSMVIASERKKLELCLQEAKRTLGEIDIEIRPFRTGGARWVRLQGKFSRFQDENPIYYFVASDITSTKENSLLLEQQNAKLNLVFANSTFEMWEVNLKTHHVTTLTRTILGGQDPLEFDNPVQFLSESQLIHQDYIPSLQDDFKALEEGLAIDSILKIRCRDNVYRFLKISYTFVTADNGDQDYAIGIFQDVDDEIEARLSLFGYESLFFAAFDMESGKPILAEKYSRTFIGPEMNLFPAYQRLIQQNIHPDDIAEFSSISTVQKLREFGKNGKKELSFEARMHAPQDVFKGYHWCLFSFSFSNNMTSTNTALFLGIKDINSKKIHELELINQAHRDSLTGLLNRYSLEELVNKVIEKSLHNEKITGFFIIDIDNFKSINDTYGHDYGDEVLRFIAQTLNSMFSPLNIIARLGGDELLVCLPELTSKEAAHQQGLHICKEIAGNKFSLCAVSCSIGVSIAPLHGKDYKDLYQNADLALYMAKQQGRNTCCLFDGIKAFPRTNQWVNHEWLLDSLEEIIFLCDSKTKEMIFLNKSGREKLGNAGNYLGSKCYELLFGITENCPYCNAQSLSSEKWTVWDSQEGLHGNPCRFKKKLISWNGRPAIFCITSHIEKDDSSVSNTNPGFVLEKEEILDFLEITSLANWDYKPADGIFMYSYNLNGKRNHGSCMLDPFDKTDFSIIHPEDKKTFIAYLQQEILCPQGRSLNIRLDFSKTFEYSYYRMSCFAIVDSFGSVVRLGGSLTKLSSGNTTTELLPSLANQLPTPLVLFSYTRGNPIIFANDSFYAFFEYNREEYDQLYSRNCFALIHSADLSELQQVLDLEISKKKTKVTKRIRVACKERGYIWVHAFLEIMYGCGNSVIYLHIEEDKLTQRIEVSSIFRNLQDLVETFPQGIGVFSLEKNTISSKFSNRELAKLLGYKEQAFYELEQTNPLGMFHTEDASILSEAILQAKWPDPPKDYRMRAVKSDGSLIFVNLVFKYFEHFAGAIFFYMVFNEISSFNALESQRVQAVDKLEYSLSHCLLTGLYTRQRFFDETERMFIANKDKRYVMVCWNIERFSIINELLGIEIGNQVLQTLAAKIRDYIGEEGTFSRLEADHFAACMPYDRCTPEALQNSINLDTLMKELNFSISLVFGLYLIEDQMMPVPLMCDRANLAVKATKGNYLKNYAFYKEVLSSTRMDEQTIISEMKDALQHGEFCFYLQPIYYLEKGTISSAEALVRWNHPEKGILNPSEFIPVFERFGFITTLDLYIWDLVCSYLCDELKKGRKPVPISVNLSRIDLCDRNLSKLLIETAKKYQVPSNLLELEVTETAYMDNPSQMKDLVKVLQDYGFTILMDDFGTGYSSLNMLNSIPMDIVKVDQNFLHSLNKDERSSKILETIVALGKALRFPVIAEGVETEEQLRYLKNIGCDHVQGFYYSKPLTTEAFGKLLDG